MNQKQGDFLVQLNEEKYLSLCPIRSKMVKKVKQVLLLFISFHAFWLLFYFLSNSNFFEGHFWYYYSRQIVIDSIGFVGFLSAVYFLFPNLNIRKKRCLYIFFALALVIILGWLQFEAQEWKINSDPYTTVAVKPNSVKAVRLQQPGGAIIYAMLKEAVYLLLGLGYAYMLDSIKKDKKAKALENANMQAELKILRYQINPHFLFNTINNIYYLALIQSEKTADALLQLSKILRYILNEKEATVSLGQEVEYLEQYIQLQLFRFPEGCIRKNISLDYKIRQRTIAPLLLITFVENAFKHGVSDRADTPILISLSNENGSLYYEVVNQIGDKLSKDSTMGIGLANLKRRLELLYPSSHHLELMEKEGHFIAKLHLSSL